MRIYMSVVTAVAALLVLPASLMASQGSAVCRVAVGTEESYSWDFTKEASMLLNEIEDQSAEIRRTVASKMVGADYLTVENNEMAIARVSDRVNEIGDVYSRLQCIRRVTSPWQQRAIDRLGPSLVQLAAQTEEAVVTLRDQRGPMAMRQSYDRNLENIYRRAGLIEDFVEISSLRDRLEMLETNVGLQEGS